MMKKSDNFPLIVTKNLEHVYSNGTIALRGINLNISKGELIAIMGKNGAGKTTLIRTFNGLIRPSKGKIFFSGKNTNSKTIAELSTDIGLIFQNPQHQLFSNTIEDEIKFSLKNFDFNEKEIQSRINNILKRFNLEKYKERSPFNLSGGETKKLAIASVFCRDPDVLIFDEPTLGQDAREINFFISLIKEEIEKGKTIIIVTHNIEFAMENVPRTILMADGGIIADGPTAKVLKEEFFAEKSSLLIPQVYQFNKALQEMGIKTPNNIKSKKEMLDFLKNYLKQYFKNIQGEI